jgi:hypothetical protein
MLVSQNRNTWPRAKVLLSLHRVLRSFREAKIGKSLMIECEPDEKLHEEDICPKYGLGAVIQEMHESLGGAFWWGERKIWEHFSEVNGGFAGLLDPGLDSKYTLRIRRENDIPRNFYYLMKYFGIYY